MNLLFGEKLYNGKCFINADYTKNSCLKEIPLSVLSNWENLQKWFRLFEMKKAEKHKSAFNEKNDEFKQTEYRWERERGRGGVKQISMATEQQSTEKEREGLWKVKRSGCAGEQRLSSLYTSSVSEWVQSSGPFYTRETDTAKASVNYKTRS